VWNAKFTIARATIFACTHSTDLQVCGTVAYRSANLYKTLNPKPQNPTP
jgi:hypothetical protein